MNIDANEISFHNPSGGFGVELVSWVCPICGLTVDTKITQRDFDRLGIEELRKIMEKAGEQNIQKRHRCKFVPIWYSEGEYLHAGIDFRTKGRGNSGT